MQVIDSFSREDAHSELLPVQASIFDSRTGLLSTAASFATGKGLCFFRCEQRDPSMIEAGVVTKFWEFHLLIKVRIH